MHPEHKDLLRRAQGCIDRAAFLSRLAHGTLYQAHMQLGRADATLRAIRQDKTEAPPLEPPDHQRNGTRASGTGDL